MQMREQKTSGANGRKMGQVKGTIFANKEHVLTFNAANQHLEWMESAILTLKGPS